MDSGEYEACTYCNRSIFPDVAECPYCHNYTDGKGPFALQKERRIPRIFIIAGWLALLGMLLPLLFALFQWFSSKR